MFDNAKTRGILVYLFIAFGGAWVLWITALLAGVPATDPLFQYVALPGGFAPAVAAVVTRKWVTHEGFADAGLKLRLRRGWPYYLFAWLLPLVVVAIIVALAAVLGVDRPDFTLQRALGELAPGANPPSFPSSGLLVFLLVVGVLIQAVVLTPILWGEEFGWRGYLQVRLLAGRPLLAAVVTGLIWGMWHYPIILAGYERYESTLLGLLIFPVLTVLLSIIFGWLRLRTGSVWCASLAHASTNAVGGSLTALLFLGGSSMTLVGYGGVFAWVALGALCVDHLQRTTRILQRFS